MKRRLLAVSLLFTLLFLTIPARADVIDDDVEWFPYGTAVPAEEPVPEPEEIDDPPQNPDAETPAGNTDSPAAETRTGTEGTGTITAEAEFISFPVIGLAAGLLALAVTLLIRSISRIRREDLFEKERQNR